MKRGLEDEDCNDDDMRQQSMAYMKTKNFMAKRIFEQQSEIESLKEQLMSMNLKYMQLWDSYKLSVSNTNGFNLSSSSELANSLVIDDKDGSNEPVLISNVDFGSPEQDSGKSFEKVIQQLKAENMGLVKELETLKLDNSNKDLTVSRLTSDRVLLYNELSELVMSLKKLNLEVFNKLYKETAKPSVISSLGIKFNILSAVSQLSMVTMNSGCSDINLSSCMHAIKKFEDELYF
jgi:hypothetical protein